jgi:hypothetical protein
MNPNVSYDPGLPQPPRPPDANDPPKVSDRFDGIDSAYHITASVVGAPTNAVVEAYLKYPLQNELTIGTLDRVAGSTDVWELFWDVPENLPEGAATMTVRLYSQTTAGIEEVAAHDVPVDMQHKGSSPPTPPDIQPADETVEITWPSQNGQLGFFKGKSGPWRTIIDGSASSRSEAVDLFYSVTAKGKEPVFKSCGAISVYNTPEYDAVGSGNDSTLANQKAIPFQAACDLTGTDKPSQVTSVAIVPLETDKPERNEANISGSELTQDSADVHVVQPYLQDPARMTASLLSNPNPTQPSNKRRVGGQANNTSDDACLAFMVLVDDHLGRPVDYVNVDVHAKGPGDQIQFGDENNAASDGNRTSGGYTKPDKGTHTEEGGRNCTPTGAANPPQGRFLNVGLQGDHNVPGGDDTKHRESSVGTGPGGGGDFSQFDAGVPPMHGFWRFHVFSDSPGITELTAWIDEESIASEADKRVDDTDTLDEGEPFATNFAQWYAAAPTVDFVPAGGTSAAGTCFKYIVRARSGTAPIPGINIDVHVKGPDDNLDFCDVDGGSPRRAPDRGPASTASPHQEEDSSESAHVEQSPRSQHTEGETDDNGNFVIGLTSPATGDTTITAWLDGEKEFQADRDTEHQADKEKDSDNDIQDAGEATKTVGHSWSTGAGNAKISWLNPSGYGAGAARTGGDQIGNKPDADSRYHLVARVDSVEEVTGVEFSISSDGTVFTPIGAATRVGTTDTWELAWDVNVTDGNKTLRAQIVGTSVIADRLVFVNNSPAPATAPDPMDIPLETAEITTPVNGTPVGFDKRALSVSGVASTGADGVEVFYTKVPGRQSPETADWIFCGYLDLNGSSTAPQGFKATCTVTGSDQPSQVTGVAAIAMDCLAQYGNNCDAARPTPPAAGAPTPPRRSTYDSGDAHRVFGTEASPLIALEPAETAKAPGGCQRLVLTVLDQTGQPVADRNVDVHVTGPDDGVTFCDPGDGDPRRAADAGGHSFSSDDTNAGFHEDAAANTIHTETETTSGGRFIFGIKSPTAGDSTIVAWVDNNDNDAIDVGENSDQSIVHWTGSPPTGNGCTIEGTSSNDRLEGTSEDDVICGFGGDDTIIGGGGNDILRGGGGNDLLRGGGAQDRLVGGGGRDILVGKAGNDTLQGRGNGDVAKGGGGADTITGNRGGDRLAGGEGNDQISGGPGKDRLDGGGGSDSCSGGPGRNTQVRCE